MPLVYGSVCSGIEACTQAWHSLGWRAAFFAEIEKFPSAVLAQRWPGVVNAGDFTQIESGQFEAIDLLAGGTPCQDFSVAGKRGGLDAARGNLTLDYARLARRLRSRWLVWENVPGVFSLNGGRDFGAVLAAFAGYPAGSVFAPPEKGWSNTGIVEPCPGGEGWGLAWCVLDAQYVRVDTHPFAVPQRRRRVFIVGYSGDWRPAAAVLLEPEGLRGDPAPRRQSGQGPAPSLSSRPTGGGGLGTDFDCDGRLVMEAFGGNDTRGPREVSTAVRAHAGSHVDFESETFIAQVAPPLDASYGRLHGASVQDQRHGHGHLVPSAIPFDTTQITSPGNVSSPEPGDPSHPLSSQAHPPAIAFNAREDAEVTGDRSGPLGAASPQAQAIAFSSKDHGADADDKTAPTLRAMGHDASHPNAGGQVAVAQTFSIMPQNSGKDYKARPVDVSQPVMGAGPVGGNQGGDYVQTAMQVRRLTPRECERLQGFPDDFTAIAWRGKTPENCPDGPRYKALGNSMAVNVMRWIGQRIEIVDGVMRT